MGDDREVEIERLETENADLRAQVGKMFLEYKRKDEMIERLRTQIRGFSVSQIDADAEAAVDALTRDAT